MNILPHRIALALMFLLITATGALPEDAAKPSTGTTPLEWSRRMADSEMERLGSTLCNKPLGSGTWDYTTGLYADALIRLSERTGDNVYEKSAEQIIGSFIGPDGKIATYGPKKKTVGSPNPTGGPSSPAPSSGQKAIPGYSLDQVQSGVATLKLYDLTHDERYRQAADILRDQLRKQPRVEEGGFWHKGGYPEQMWLDGLYMAEPFYADYAVRFNEPADFDDIANQFEIIAKHTYDAQTGLFYHGWDATKKLDWANPETGASRQFWSRAIGWYAMGLADVLGVMPATNPRRSELVALLQKVAAGLVKHQDPGTGVWWQVTDRPNGPHNYLEASASCMFVYALAKGVNDGDLPRSYIPAIRVGYGGIFRQFITFDANQKDINLNRCCQVAGLEVKYKATYEYYTQVVRIVPNDLKGVGPFINAGIECDKLFGRDTFGP